MRRTDHQQLQVSQLRSTAKGKRKSATRPGRFLRCEALEDRRLLATVNTLIDVVNPSDGLTTLREAIAAATPGETIDFSVEGTIRLSSLGQLNINKALTINGPGPYDLTIEAYDPTPSSNNGDGSRVFNIDDGLNQIHRNVSLSGLYLTGGDTNIDGGAIFTRENLTVNYCFISQNSAGTAGGGGIFQSGAFSTLTITNGLLRDNTATDGGAIASYGTVAIVESTFFSNVATYGGGISHNQGNLTITDSTLGYNRAAQGGGILSETNAPNRMSIVNSTITGNYASVIGGGIHHNMGTTQIRHSTITRNIADNDVGGVGAGVSVVSGALTIDHTIVAGNKRISGCSILPCSGPDDDLLGAVAARYSLIGTLSGTTLSDLGGNIPNVDPGLGPLANNGGFTGTHALPTNSPATNAGDPSFAAPPGSDQRGFSRVAGGRIDIGAFESVDGDFNNDGLYDRFDIDTLVFWIALEGHALQYDLTGDTLVNLADRDAWLAEAGGVNLGAGRVYRLGDATLDGVVDGSDFGRWNANKFTTVAAWSRGDFNADGAIDGSDFGIWNSNKFTSSDGAASTVVPVSSLAPIDRHAHFARQTPRVFTAIETDDDESCDRCSRH